MFVLALASPLVHLEMQLSVVLILRGSAARIIDACFAEDIMETGSRSALWN